MQQRIHCSEPVPSAYPTDHSIVVSSLPFLPTCCLSWSVLSDSLPASLPAFFSVVNFRFFSVSHLNADVFHSQECADLMCRIGRSYELIVWTRVCHNSCNQLTHWAPLLSSCWQFKRSFKMSVQCYRSKFPPLLSRVLYLWQQASLAVSVLNHKSWDIVSLFFLCFLLELLKCLKKFMNTSKLIF